MDRPVSSVKTTTVLALIACACVILALGRSLSTERFKATAQAKPTLSQTHDPKIVAKTSLPMDEDEVLDAAARALSKKAKAKAKSTQKKHHKLRIPKIPKIAPTKLAKSSPLTTSK